MLVYLLLIFLLSSFFLLSPLLIRFWMGWIELNNWVFNDLVLFSSLLLLFLLFSMIFTVAIDKAQLDQLLWFCFFIIIPMLLFFFYFVYFVYFININMYYCYWFLLPSSCTDIYIKFCMEIIFVSWPLQICYFVYMYYRCYGNFLILYVYSLLYFVCTYIHTKFKVNFSHNELLNTVYLSIYLYFIYYM